MTTKMTTQPTLHEALELLPPSSAAQASSENQTPSAQAHPVIKGLRAVGGYLVQVIAASQDPEIYVQLTCDGSRRFSAYDPVTNRRCTDVDEDSLRTWLELRYYATPIR